MLIDRYAPFQLSTREVSADELIIFLQVDVQPRESGIYYTPGTGTPLRTHSGLSSTFSSGGNNKSNRSTPLSSIPLSLSSNSLSANSPGIGISPVYKNNYLNGRLRLPSGTPLSSAGGNKNRAWSEIKSKLVVEDEEKKELEREKRRAASVRLGGEVPEIVDSGKGKEKEVVVAEVVEEKLKLPTFAPEKSLFGIPPVSIEATTVSSIIYLYRSFTFANYFCLQVASTSTAPKVLPAFNLKPIPSSATPTPSPSLFSAPAKASTPASLPPLSIPSTTTSASKVPDFFSKPLATSPKAPAIPNFFGNAGIPTTAKSSATQSVPVAPTPVASFSFGSAPVAPKISELPTSTQSTSFSFTPATVSSPAATLPPVVPTSAPAISTGGFSFGSSTAISTPATTSTTVQSPFSFAPAPSSVVPTPPTSGFSFGATTTPIPAATPNSFSFGSKSTALPTPPIPLPSSTSLFGTAPSASTTSVFGTPTVPSISASPFGNTTSAFGATPSTTVAPFSFSNPTPAAVSTGSPFGALPATTSTPSFSFGAPASSAPSFGAGAGGGFGTASPFGSSTPFGASTPIASSGGFSFGIPNAAPGSTSGIFGGGAAPTANSKFYAIVSTLSPLLIFLSFCF